VLKLVRRRSVGIVSHYLATVATDWPADRAFAYLSDLEHFADWDPGVKRAEQVEGTEPALGAAYDVTVSGVGRDLVLRYVVIELDPGHRITVEAETSTLVSHDVIMVEPTATGSLVTYDASLDLKGVARIGSPLLALAFRRIGDRAADGLRRALHTSIA